jgi:hypothetical protein
MLAPIRALSLKVIRCMWMVYPNQATPRVRNERYSIGVVTYIRRYEQYLKPLVSQFYKLFPDTEIVIAVNGYYDQAQQEAYLREIRVHVAQYPNVKLITHTEPQSLAKLWNELIINSATPKTIIFNDDVLLLPSFRRHLEKSGVTSMDIAVLKLSWSHFLISKRVVSQIGWFDERFPGVGNEDEDYEARLALRGMPVESVTLGGLKNIVVKTKDFSYGKTVDMVNDKYMNANKRFFHSKWDLSDNPRDGYAYVRILGRHARIKAGMETPDFYPAMNYAESKS